jgi:hypothetical protein
LSCLDIAEKAMKVTEVESNFENFVGGRVIVETPYDRIQRYCASSVHRRFTMGQYVGHGEDEVNSRNNERLGVKANTWILRACEY